MNQTTDYGRPMKPFHWNPELLGLGRQIGQINSGAFGVFSAELSAPILVLLVPWWAVKNLGNNVHTSVFGAVNNASEVVSPICLPKPKSSGFQWKKASLDVHSPCLMLSNKSRCVEIAVIITFSVLVHYTTEVSKCSGNKNICTCLIANTHEKNSIQE